MDAVLAEATTVPIHTNKKRCLRASFFVGTHCKNQSDSLWIVKKVNITLYYLAFPLEL